MLTCVCESKLARLVAGRELMTNLEGEALFCSWMTNLDFSNETSCHVWNRKLSVNPAAGHNMSPVASLPSCRPSYPSTSYVFSSAEWINRLISLLAVWNYNEIRHNEFTLNNLSPSQLGSSDFPVWTRIAPQIDNHIVAAMERYAESICNYIFLLSKRAGKAKHQRPLQ